MKKAILFLMILLLTMSLTTVSAFATADGTIKRTSSSHKVDSKVITAQEARSHSKWKKGYYKAKAYGYVTVKKYNKRQDRWIGYRHYSNAELLNTGRHEKYSGRIWGTGKVSADTGYSTKSCGIVPDFYGSAIYYGW